MRILPILFTILVATQAAAEFHVVPMAKKHEGRSDTFPDRPYGNDDMSYGIFFDFFEGMGAWRIGVSGSDDVTGIEGVDSVITPEIGLLALDGIWEAGISILMDYVNGEDDSDWGDLYYQVHLALNLPLTESVRVGIGAYYPFGSFGDITDFSTSDLDYAVTLRLSF
jgi:hypothetical protein